MIKNRYIKPHVLEDLEEKMVFISGPRQVGKTTFAKSIVDQNDAQYYNWDYRGDRKKILSGKWAADKNVLILDEVHKYRHWKQWIKGEYDVHGERFRFIVTGSARLDVYRKGGDSLQGRYHSYRLHGFSAAEFQTMENRIVPGRELEFPQKYDHNIVKSLFQYGPFPEPFLKQNERALRRWQKERLDRFFREDVRDLENVKDLSSMELLADMLGDRAGSLLSLESIREDLNVSHKAVTHWMEILERLYYCFRLSPYSHNAVKALRKATKGYLWDYSLVESQGGRFENLIAVHLLKLKHYLEDRDGYRIGLYYLRDVDKREVDFLVTIEKKPWFAVECKIQQRSPNPALKYFGDRLNIPYLYQVSLEGEHDYLDGDVRIIPAGKFLSALI